VAGARSFAACTTTAGYYWARASTFTGLSTEWPSNWTTRIAGIGDGGIERWVAYPVVLCVIGFGGHLMARAR
jgi:hypothetical protein